LKCYQHRPVLTVCMQQGRRGTHGATPETSIEQCPSSDRNSSGNNSWNVTTVYNCDTHTCSHHGTPLVTSTGQPPLNILSAARRGKVTLGSAKFSRSVLECLTPQKVENSLHRFRTTENSTDACHPIGFSKMVHNNCQVISFVVAEAQVPVQICRPNPTRSTDFVQAHSPSERPDPAKSRQKTLDDVHP
jgi:hypothetical protein